MLSCNHTESAKFIHGTLLLAKLVYYIYFPVAILVEPFFSLNQAGAVEYTNCTSAEG